MYTPQKLLQMLSSTKASVRYDACEWLRVSPESSPEIVRALELATHDQDKEVVERAKYALQADVHHQMAIEMGIVKPDEPVTKRIIYAPLSGEKESLKSCFFVLLGCIFIIVGLVSFINEVSDVIRISQSKTWPATRGEVISTRIVHIQEYEGGSHSVPVITYRYTVSGSDYYSELSSNWDTNKKLPVGSAINISFNPDRPEVCVSEYDTVQISNFFFSLLFFALGSIFVWSIYKGSID